MERGAYRGDVDGLRAVAILPVLFFHAAIWPFAGGYVGVDVFFVISGFLITGLILRQSAQGRFSLLDFYDRRIRRILPALATMLVVAMAAAVAILLPDELILFAHSFVTTALFVANIDFWHQAKGYFGPAPATNPLLHVWSLAVEEQFYLLWPWLLPLLARRRRMMPLLLVAFAGLSFAGALLVSRASPDAAFFLLPTRAWELLLGASLAAGRHDPMPARFAPVSVAVGCVLIGLAILQSAQGFPGFNNAAAAIGAVLVLEGGRVRNPLSTLMGSALPAFVGRISYSLYLWHWPFIVFAALYLSRPLTLAERLFVLLATVPVAVLSWRFVEQPARRGAPRFGAVPASFPLAALACLVLLGCGGSLWLSRGWPARLPPPAAAMLADSGFDNPRSCLISQSGERPGHCALAADPPRDQLVVWGDSFADALAPGLTGVSGARGLVLREIAMGRCPPLPGLLLRTLDGGENRPCMRNNAAVERQVLGNPHVRIVVLHALWESYFSIPDAPNSEQAAFTASLDRIVGLLTRHGVEVLIVGALPHFPSDPPRCLARNLLLKRQGENCTAVPDPRTQVSDRIIAGVAARHPGTRVFSPRTLFCDGQVCHAMGGGHLLFRDSYHLNSRGTRLVGDAIGRNPGL